MRKRALLLLFFLMISAYHLRLAYSQAGFGAGLQIVDSAGPIINSSLLNNSGFAGGNATLFFNVSDASNVYNCTLMVDAKYNSSNGTISKYEEINFRLDNLSIGRYNFSINCTDVFNNSAITQNLYFTVNYMGKFNGTTTNTSLIDLRNVSHFVTEVAYAGKINFSETIDLSKGFDLDKFINISPNKIGLDSNALRDFNESAVLHLYGLAFSSPRILMDGAECPSSVCTKISYSGGVLIFNVTHFTSYSAEETPGSGDGGGGSSGGGGGGGGGSGGGGGAPPAIPIKTEFTTDKTTLKVVLKQGQTKEETLSIKNIGTNIFDVKYYLENIEKFVTYPEGEITTLLNPNEERMIKFVFQAMENEKPDIYTGKIRLKGPSSEKEVNALIEVDSAEPLFDVDVEVLPDSKSVFPGQELLAEVNLFNVRGFGRVDVVVEYSIKDFGGNLLATEHETLAVETQAKFTRKILVPSDLKPGNYAVFAKVIYADSVGISSDLFDVKAKAIRLYPIQINGYKTILLVGAMALVAGILIFSAYQFGHLKNKAPKTKTEAVEQVKEEEKTQKLRKELEALESAYKSGFISEESYLKGRKRIEDKINSLK